MKIIKSKQIANKQTNDQKLKLFFFDNPSLNQILAHTPFHNISLRITTWVLTFALHRDQKSNVLSITPSHQIIEKRKTITNLHSFVHGS